MNSILKISTLFVLLNATLVTSASSHRSAISENDDKLNHQIQDWNERRLFKRDDDSNWTHNDQNEWYGLNNSCSGKRQSPINIDPSKAVKDDSLSLHFHDYDQKFQSNIIEVINTGHTLQMNMVDDVLSTITGTAVGKNCTTYELLQVHWHWGNGTDDGSEHAIAGKRYAAEVHFVHRNSRYYNKLTASKRRTKFPDFFTVIGVLATIGKENEVLNMALDTLPNTKYEKDGKSTQMKGGIYLKDLLPANRNKFYKYSGSLTTPDCDEIVTWIVMKEMITISQAQLVRLRKLENTKHELMLSTVRELQPIGNRVVYHTDSSPGSSSHLRPIEMVTTLILVMIAVAIQDSILR